MAATMPSKLMAPSTLSRFLRKPDGEAPALTQAGLIVRPVGHLVALPRDMVTAVLVQLERHGEHPDQEGYTPMPDRFPAPQADPCITVEQVRAAQHQAASPPVAGADVKPRWTL